MPSSITIREHNTGSVPHLHKLYTIELSLNDTQSTIRRGYIEFAELHAKLNVTEFALPPNIQEDCADDELIAQLKDALAVYVDSLINCDNYRNNPAVIEFLSLISSVLPEEDRDSNVQPSASHPCLMMNMALPNEVEVRATPPIAAAYYPDWSVYSNPPEKMDFAKFDILFFSFATPNSESKIQFEANGINVLKRLVAAAKKSGKGTKIVLSIGGWGGSQWFHQTCRSAVNRKMFVNSIAGAVDVYSLAGVDIDWEYPNSAGAGNPHGPKDAENLLYLVQGLRQKLGPNRIISAAVAHLPWIGPNGAPLKNVSAYAAQMSFVNIMNYDVWGSSPNPGPNAPLGCTCGSSAQPHANAQAALKQWTAAGFPASKLLLGLPLYGYVSQSTRSSLSHVRSPASHIAFPQNDGQNTTDHGDKVVGNVSTLSRVTGAHMRVNGVPDTELRATANLQAFYDQQIAFKQLVSAGALMRAPNGAYIANGGFTRGFDACSHTPFLFNVPQRTFVSYDDPQSLADKAAFAKKMGMAGCFTWSLDQDDGTKLQQAIRAALGRN